MANYYVRKTGSDAAAGTSAGAAWLTIGKALGAAGIASGDTVYVGGGVYREAVTVAMTSATAETIVIADVDGANTGDAGEVRWTAYLTNDSTAPGATRPLTLNGRDFLTFRDFVFQGGTTGTVDATTTNSTNIKFEDCIFKIGSAPGQNTIAYTGLADVAANWTLDRCIIYNIGVFPVAIVLPTSAVADYDANFLIRNCLIIGGSRNVRITTSGAAAFKGGGVDLLNCTILPSASAGALECSGTNLSTSIPCTVTNCLISAATGLSAGATGQIIEDYNHIYATTPRTNVTAGANSVSDGSKALLVHLGQEVRAASDMFHPFMSPTDGSPQLGAGTNTGAPATDLLGTARPNPPSIGCYELYTPPAAGGGGIAVLTGGGLAR